MIRSNHLLMEEYVMVDSIQQKLTEEIGDYVLNYRDRSLTFGSQSRRLTTKEFKLLKMLFDNKGKLLDRNETLTRIWGKSDYFNRRSMDVYVSKLRKYLSEDPAIRIKNVHGKGYIFYLNR